MNYRSLPRYANSDLSEYRDLLFFGKAKAPSTPAQVFGTLFHDLVLEAKPPTGISTKMRAKLTAMQQAVFDNSTACEILSGAAVEQIQLWDDAKTGLPCKAKTDIVAPGGELMGDLKTTSCRNYKEFLASCERYAYDRQAAFYLDGNPGASHFIFLGVQKQAPFDVFIFEATANPGYIEEGRKKYQALLRSIEKVGFVPSSWGPQTLQV
ncbi:MAG: PD-(D/E)XK nuclease-like domain-containing protein [Bacteroidetes bacterium]|nr:PD-(D/E)XK nuclease-like domain-containing protein [Bacteroidota bacterium]